MPPRPIGEHTTIELQNIVKNHRERGKTDAPRYLEAFEELGRRRGQGFEFEKSLTLIRDAAAERRFLSYKQLADAHGLEWSRVRYAINNHLGDLLEYSHLKGIPLLSAIVVNQQNVATGSMEPKTLTGFALAARALGYAFGDDATFLKEQQEAVFQWASGAKP